MSDAEVVQEPARKQAANLVTNENLAEFNAQKLGLATQETPTEAAEAEPVVEQERSEPEAETEAAAGEKKHNPKLEKRFSELTKQREAARLGLQKLPRNASPVRVRSRDAIDGRPRGVLTKFGLSRVRFRDMAHKGELPGITKSSW